MAGEEFLKLPPQDLIFKLPPTFDNVEAERRHRKERLTAALRLFGKFGFEEGVAGHITARDPELTDHFWVNPFRTSAPSTRITRCSTTTPASSPTSKRASASPPRWVPGRP
jgi:hypothetical protein